MNVPTIRVGSQVEIVDRMLYNYYRESNKIDTITHILYDPFSRSNFVLLQDDTREYKFPSNLKVIKL